MRKQNYALFGVLSLFLAMQGCATYPTGDPAVQARALTFEAEPGLARVYVVRPKQFNASGVLMFAALDGRMLGALATSSYFVLDLEPGLHELTSSWDALVNSAPLTFRVEEGDVSFVRVVARGQLPVAERLGPEQGRKAIPAYQAIPAARTTAANETIVESQPPGPAPVGMGRVYVAWVNPSAKASPRGSHTRYDASQFPPNMVGIGVLIDDRILGAIPKGTWVGMTLEPGRHRVLGTLNMLNTFAPHEFELRAGESRYFEVDTGFASAPVTELDQEVGRGIVGAAP